MKSKPEFEIKVNGVLIKVAEDKLTAGEILKRAKDHNAMPRKPEDYELQGEKRLYKPDEWVNFEEDKEFITIPIGPTDVAEGWECPTPTA